MKICRFLFSCILPELALLWLVLALVACVHAQGSYGAGQLSGSGQLTSGGNSTSPPPLPVLQWLSIPSFPSTNTGSTSSVQTAVLENVGVQVALIQGFSLSGTNSGDFAITGNTCAGSLAQGVTCNVTLTFSPSAIGSRTALLNVASNALTNPTANLSGIGLSPPQADASLTPSALVFPNTTTSVTSSALTATLTSNGTATLNIASTTLSGTNAANFSISGNTCGATLTVSSTCAISVTCTPSVVGLRSAQLNVTSDAATSPNVTTLSCTGIAPSTPVANLTAAVAFPNTTQGVTSVSLAAVLSNTGNAALTISSTSLAGSNPGDFAQTNNCGSSVAAGQSCTFNITFTPTTTGARAATLSVSDNASGSPHTTALSGTGIAVSGALAINTTSCPNAIEGVAYPGCTIQVTGGTPPYQFTTPAGQIPNSTPQAGWQQVPIPPAATQLIDFAIDSSNTWYYADRSSGFYKSTDQGATFTAINNSGIPLNATSIDVNPNNQDLIAVAGSKPVNFYRSQDKGATWTQIPINPFTLINNLGAYSGCTFAKNNANILCGGFWSQGSGTWVSSDNGVTSLSITKTGANSFNDAGELGDTFGMATNPVTGSIWVGTEVSGIYKSIDNGLTFNRVSGRALTYTPADPQAIDVGNTRWLTFDNGGNVFASTVGGIMKSPDNASISPNTWTKVFNKTGSAQGKGMGRDSAGNLYYGHRGDPTDTHSVRRSTDGGVTWPPFDQNLPPNMEAWHFVQNLADGRMYVNLQDTLTNAGQVWRTNATTQGTAAIDLLDYFVGKLPDRNTFHWSGATQKSFRVQNGLVWWEKGNSGNPWDGWWYDSNYFYFAFTEDGDPTDQAACQTAGYTSCFVDPNAYKLDISTKKFAPRYWIPGTTVTIMSPPTLTAGNVNPYQRTTNCGADNQPVLYLGNVKTVLSGPVLTSFGGNAGNLQAAEIDYYYSGNVSGVYNSRERFYIALSTGQLKWDVASLQNGTYVVSQTSLNVTKTNGGAPTPNFACGVPAPPFNLAGNLPPAAKAPSRGPWMQLGDSSGAISGTPTTSGTYPFTAQVEDAAHSIVQQQLSLAVVCPAFTLTPSGTLPPATQGQAYSFSFSTSGGILPVTWSQTGTLPTGLTFSSGTLSGTPSVAGTYSFTVAATDSCNPTGTVQSHQVSLTVSATGGALTITTPATLPSGIVNSLYSTPIQATGGTAPYACSITAGALPAGLSLGGCSISGTPTTAGTSSVTIKVTDNVAANVSQVFSLTINPAPSGAADNRYCQVNETTAFPGGVTQDDGMDLPINCVRTAVADTPSPGGVVNIAAGNATALQNAFNTAACGSTIVLPAGSSFSGSFTLGLNCGATQWLTIRTSALSSLPPEGTRATPCDAGVSLPSRPFTCTGQPNSMAQLVGNGGFDETLRILPGASHIRFIGIEIAARSVAAGAQVQNIINMQPGATNHIVFDRCWFHGTANQAVVRAAFMQDGVSYVGVVDSSATDIHCINNTCTDSQFFQGGLGSLTKAAFKGVNNYVESAGTNSMSFGGGGATVMPTDFEWRRNYQYKPMIWNPACVAPLPASCRLPNGTPVTYDNLGPYSVKNILEVKDIIRALIEGNVMENNWMHADQNATAILLTPKNQSGNQCPLCVERHIVIRYNHILTSGGFLQSVNAPADDGGLATEGSHYTVHDNVAENLAFAGDSSPGFNFNTYGVSEWSHVTLPLNSTFIQHDIHIFHNTLLQSQTLNAMHQMDGPAGVQMTGMVFRDNIVPYGAYGMNQISNSACAGPLGTNFTTKINGCWLHTGGAGSYVHANNAIVGGTGTWPAGNVLPANLAAVGFVNPITYLGDYRLCTGVGTPGGACKAASPYHNAATDGKDIGADITTMLSMTAGVSPYN